MPPSPSFRGQEVDVCIVGSGAGGAPLARELARAGAKVVVLEKGPWYRAEDFDRDEIKNCRRNFWAPFVSEEPHLLSGRGGKPQPTNVGWTSNCVGGGTVHMSGYFYRLAPEDFRLASRYDGGIEGATPADWPITYEELSPYYDRAERIVGVSGTAGAHPFEPPRTGEYPMGPLRENPLAALVDRGASELGLHPYRTPRAITSESYRGRAECVYCDFCGSYGCRVGAKGSTLATLIPEAIETGRCEVRPHSMAYEVHVDDRGRARSVRYFDEEGTPHEQKARVVVVSATAVESARLLLHSTSSAFPDGLANGSGLVGRNLCFSTLAKGYGQFERDALPEKMRPIHEVHFLNRSVRDLYLIDERRGAYDKGGVINFMLPHRNPIFTAERLSTRHDPPLWGAGLQAELHRYYEEIHELEFEVYGEFLANPQTFVDLSEDVRDKWGLPVAHIHLQNHPEDRRNSEILLERGLSVLEAAGATKTGSESVGQTTYILQHGTCRFGDDPKTSVLDRHCRSHEVPNLYVVDGSFMPTSGGVPTTLTIMANSLRVADHLVEAMRRGGLDAPAPSTE